MNKYYQNNESSPLPDDPRDDVKPVVFGLDYGVTGIERLLLSEYGDVVVPGQQLDLPATRRGQVQGHPRVRTHQPARIRASGRLGLCKHDKCVVHSFHRIVNFFLLYG